MRIEEWSVVYAYSPCQHLRKCIENSMENMHNIVKPVCKIVSLSIQILKGFSGLRNPEIQLSPKFIAHLT